VKEENRVRHRLDAISALRIDKRTDSFEVFKRNSHSRRVNVNPQTIKGEKLLIATSLQQKGRILPTTTMLFESLSGQFSLKGLPPLSQTISFGTNDRTRTFVAEQDILFDIVVTPTMDSASTG
jgi:hypothetical protein